MSASCSASELAQITVMPFSAALRRAAKICWRVPTSTPCVGSSSSSSDGARFIQRAISTFCALPPERAESFSDGIVGTDLERRAKNARRTHHFAVPHAAAAEEAAHVGQKHVVDDGEAIDAAGTLPIGGK